MEHIKVKGNRQPAPYSRNNKTEDEIAAALPGYKPHESTLGHYLDTPTGKAMIIGAHPNDQVFGSEVFGMINVSLILETLDKAGVGPVTVGIDDGIKQHIAKVEINQEWVRKISSARLREPVVMIVAHDGMNVLDGHHRLARHILNKSRSFPALIVPPDGLEFFQVRQFRQDPALGWVMQAGAHPDDIKRMITTAKQRWTPQNIVRSRG